NGIYGGKHSGGYTPFHFDITDALQVDKNEIVVRVRDSLDPRIPRGKQSFLGVPFMIFYTTVTGIWQSVYMETVGTAYIENVVISSVPENGDVRIKLDMAGEKGCYTTKVEITAPDGKLKKSESEFEIDAGEKCRTSVAAKIKTTALWSPEKPNLYNVRINIIDSDGEVQDSLQTYFGFRRIEIENGTILLNGAPLYQKLLLNQGYFPDGHYTPPENDIFRSDIQQAKDMGFNGVRMHQKIESKHFLFWADVLGFLMWGEMPAAFVWSKKMRDAIRRQWEEVCARDANHPSIITWVLFCESWGVNNLIYSEHARNFVREMVSTASQEDHTRLVIDNSGFEHVETDVLDIHQYLGSVELCREFYDSLSNPENMKFRAGNIFGRMDPAREAACPLAPTAEYNGEPIIISEYGGFGFYKTEEKPLIDNFREYTLAIAENGLFQGYCYTQQYDTEQEQNGLLDFDRNPKIPIEDIRAVNDEMDKVVNERSGKK
ncbi:glycoside hydrolase family 2 protein, partial [bacterium]